MLSSYSISQKDAESIKDFEVRDVDTFLVGFFKTGTTWCQEMIWLLGNDLNYEEAKERFVDERFPILESFTAFSQHSTKLPNVSKQVSDLYVESQKGLRTLRTLLEDSEYYKNSLKMIERQKGPRFIKTHLSGLFLPRQIQDGTRKPKIIYIARNPKDTCLSIYHFSKNANYKSPLSKEEFCKAFVSANGHYITPFWEHVLYFWNKRHDSNVLFIRYEDMKADLSQVIRQVGKFLNKPITEEQLDTLLKWLDAETMRKNNSVNHEKICMKSNFIRKAKVGSFREEMSEEVIKMFDSWTEENLKGSGLDMKQTF